MYWFIGYWFIGPLVGVCRFIGLLVHWFIGLLMYWLPIVNRGLLLFLHKPILSPLLLAKSVGLSIYWLLVHLLVGFQFRTPANITQVYLWQAETTTTNNQQHNKPEIHNQEIQ